MTNPIDLSDEQLYDLYTRYAAELREHTGELAGENLTRGEFTELWSTMPKDDRDALISTFETGFGNLVSASIPAATAAIERIRQGKLDLRIVAKLRHHRR